MNTRSPIARIPGGRWILLLLLVLSGLQILAVPAAACVNPGPGEGAPPIRFKCRPTIFGFCLPTPANSQSGGTMLLGMGGFTTAGAAAGDSCSAAVSPQGGIFDQVRSLRLVHADTGEELTSFPFSAVPNERRVFNEKTFFGERWSEFSARVTEAVPAGIPVILVFEITARDGRRSPAPLLATTRVRADGDFEHLAMTFASDPSACAAGASGGLGFGDQLANPGGTVGTCDNFCCGVCTCCANGTGSDCCNKCEDRCDTLTAP